MNRSALPAVMAGVVLQLCAFPAVAAVVIEQLVVRPNPARFGGGYPPQVDVEVTIKDRGITRLLGCELSIDFGDGTPEVRLSLSDGGPRKAATKHVYGRPGTYSAAARGRSGGGGRACDGERRVQVTVIAEPPPPEATPKDAAAISAACPPGWTLIPGSQAGPRFRCRPDSPAQKIDCQGGTKYFEESGMIGCQ
jgi:hypothetical protein